MSRLVKIKTLKEWIDKKENVTRTVDNQPFDVTEERYKEIVSKIPGYVEFVEFVEEKEEKKEKKTKKDKK